MNSKLTIKNIFINILSIVVITMIIIFIIFKDNSIEIINLIKNIDKSYLNIIFCSVLLVQVLAAYSLTCFAKLTNKQYNIFNGIGNILVSNFVSGITPSSTGGQIAQMYVFKKQRVRMSDSMSILLMDFIISQATMCGLSLVVMTFKFLYFFNTHSNLFILSLISLLFNMVIIIGLYLITKHKKCYMFLTNYIFKLACKFKLIKNINDKKVELDSFIVRFNNEIIKLKQHKTLLWKCVLIHLIKYIVYFSIPFLCFIVLGNKMSFDLYANCFAISVFVSLLNTFFPMPGASGGTEITFLLMFQTLFPIPVVQTSVLLWRFFLFYNLLFIGIIPLIYYKIKNIKDMEV